MTSRIRQWSSTAASNNLTPPNGAPEGSTYVNQLSDILRQIMAEVRAWWEAPGWIDYGHTPTYSSGTVFTVTSDQTSIYEVNRRVRATNSLGTIIYGTISGSVYSSTTAVTVAWDSGTLDSNLSEVAVGAANIANPWMSFKSLAGTLLRSQIPAEAIFQTGMTQIYFGTTAPTGWVLWFGNIGNASSSATNRANADTQDLFTQLWNAYADAQAPVSGGRGASAAADFAANKTISLPDARGCVVAVMDNLGGTAASRITSGVSGLDGTTVGGRGGDERIHGHVHGVTDTHRHYIFKSGGSQGGDSGTFTATDSVANVSSSYSAAFQSYYSIARSATPTTEADIGQTSKTSTGSIAVDSTGSGSSQNVQPTIMLPYIVKL